MTIDVDVTSISGEFLNCVGIENDVNPPLPYERVADTNIRVGCVPPEWAVSFLHRLANDANVFAYVDSSAYRHCRLSN